MNKDELKSELFENAKKNMDLLSNDMSVFLEKEIGGGEKEDLHPLNSTIREYKAVMKEQNFEESKINTISAVLIGMFDIFSNTYPEIMEKDNGYAIYEYICDNYDLYKNLF